MPQVTTIRSYGPRSGWPRLNCRRGPAGYVLVASSSCASTGARCPVGALVQPAAVVRLGQLPAQRLQLASHPGVQNQNLADLPGGDRSGGLAHRGQDALIVRRQRGRIHPRRPVRDQPHRPARHLHHRRSGRCPLAGELLAHSRSSPLPRVPGHSLPSGQSAPCGTFAPCHMSVHGTAARAVFKDLHQRKPGAPAAASPSGTHAGEITVRTD